MTTILKNASRNTARIIFALTCLLILLSGHGSGLPGILQAQANPIVAENLLPGDTDWDVSGAGSPNIQGFGSDMSVNLGETIQFKIDTASTNYRIDIYRLGYYNGAGARKVSTIADADITKINQPSCMTDSSTGLIDCGNWGTNASWAVPANAVSGVYLARPTDNVNGNASHIVFVVRDDSRQADVLFQTSDTTWQAYNLYGGNNLYCGAPFSNAGTAYGCIARAVKVSYNRPMDTRDHDPQSFLFNAEYPMIRFLEANGYNVKYWSGVDTDRLGADPTKGLTSAMKPKIFLSTGHDEYWSGAQRTNVENARNAGVNLSFMSGNEVYWKTRWEPAITSATGHRTLVSYKETLNNAKIDPSPEWTGTWRDPRFSPPSDGGRPENGLIGSIWTVNCCGSSITVPSSMSGLRFWRNTRVADLLPGGTTTLASGSLGYEWGEALENGFQPDGLVRMSSTTLANQEKIINFGSLVGLGTATHTLTMYKHQSGAIVFGASTVQWAWGLDGEHDVNSGSPAPDGPDHAMQQATINLFADMGAQPGSLQVGADSTRPLQSTSQSTDIFAPTSTITSPLPSGQVESGSRVTITGTAVDAGGGAVGAVEVSVDGGTTWRKAAGTSAWSIEWIPGIVGTATIKSRATDDSGNLEMAGAGTTVGIVVGECPCTTLWKPSVVPGTASAADSGEYELGVKFTSDVDGFITGIRFYKGPANNGTHVGNLWTSTGTLLASAVFSGETATGWQQVDFGSPVAITADTIYVASYHTPNGGYAFDGGYFLSAGKDSPPLHALPSGTSGGNGVFVPGPIAFPTNSFNAANYWVDVVFAQSLEDSTAPVISDVKATTIDSSRVTVQWTTDEASHTRIDYGTDPAIQTASLSSLPPGTITAALPAFVTEHSMALSGLQPNTTYYYLVSSTDAAGNTATAAPPSFTVPGPTLRDTAATDFAAGTMNSTYVSQTADGEVILQPTVGSEFTGPGLPQGWVAINWNPGGSAAIIDGVLLVDGARVSSCADAASCAAEQLDSTPAANLFAGPRSLEFSANYSGDQFQHAGFGQTFALTTEPWAIFSTLSGGMLFARSNTGNGAIDTPVGVAPLGEFHRYRIDWNATSVDYYIDGVLVASHAVVVPGPMRPVAASDFNPFGGIIFVDWMRLMPASTPGVFESRVFDANTLVDWKAIQYAATVPAGTALQISVRTGNTAVPDGTWTPWVAIAGPSPLTLNSQFIQYRAEISTTNPFVSPELQDVIITTGSAPVAVDDFVSVAKNGTYTFQPSGLGSLTFNDTDLDAGDTLRVIAVTAPSQGVATLNADGSVAYTPALNYDGPDAFVYTVSDGLLTASATVTIDVRDGNIPPVANDDLFAVTEDTALMVPGTGVLNNDTDADGDPLTAVLVTLPQHGMLTFNAGGSFIYTPALNYAGPDFFTYRASDGDLVALGNVATVNLLVNQVNDPPFTMADAFTAVLNQPLDVPAPGVLANDRDVEVEDTNPLTTQLVSGTSRGQLTLRSDGSFSYVPDSDFLGTDSFVYASVDHFGAVSLLPKTVTLTVALKAVSAVVSGGDSVSTGGEVSPGDPLRSEVTSPTDATVSIAQGVISGSESPSGYSFLNQQVNITVTDAEGAEVTATAADPLVFVFEIDLSLVPDGQTHETFQVFRNGVLVPNCLGATSIPAANLDPCVSERSNGTKVRLKILTTHASYWNVGVESASIGDVLTAFDDGPFMTNFETEISQPAPGVLGNDFGGSTITAELFGSPIGGTVLLSPSGSFTFTPSVGHCGAASFQYRVFDGAAYSAPATVAFIVNCQPVANPDAVTVLEDSGTTAISVLVNDHDPDAQAFTITAVTQGLNGTVLIGPGGAFLTYQPVVNFHGNDSFTYTITDSRGDSATTTVSVVVTPVNDAPSFVKGADQTSAEDAALQTVNGWASGLSVGPANEGGQTLSFTTANDNPVLFSMAPTVSPDGTLTYQSAPHANGSATVTVSIQDNGGTADGGVNTSADQTFSVTVSPVNDTPSFVKGADQSMLEDTGAQSIAGWATAITAGPANESGQTVSFLVSSDNPALFSAQPAVSPDGTLTYDPALNANGAAVVSVSIKDDGGTANGGVDTSAPQAFTISVSLLNDAPTFTPGANVTVNEDGGPQTIAWATNLSPGPADEAGQALSFVIDSNSNAALFAAQPAMSSNGTLTFTPAPDASGTATVMLRLTDDGGTVNGGVDTSSAHALVITVNPVNDAPSFTSGANQGVLVNSGLMTVAGWATAISAGPANESGQALTFTTANTNNALFSVQPVVAANGTLTFAPGGVTGSAIVTVMLSDDGGTANGGVNTSTPQTFTIDVGQGTTATTVTSSNINALFGTSVQFTATVTPLPATSLAGGTVTFRRGTTTMGTGVLDAAGQATFATTTLAVGTHSVTAVYGGNPSYLGSTSAAIAQVISPSATIVVNFSIHALQDTTNRPRVQKVPVEGAIVRVYRRWEQCTDSLYVTNQPKKWGIVFDGPDGPGGEDGCPVLTFGNYRAEGTTDANGIVTIIVPPTTTKPNIDYIVIGRSLDYNVTTTPTENDAIYAAYMIASISSGQTKKARLNEIRMFSGKRVPGRMIEEYGSYLAIVEPEYMEWTDSTELYPFVLDAEGEWGVETSVVPPDGFIADHPELSALIEDGLDALQFVLTDVGSDWTETKITHRIRHNGEIRVRTTAIPMFDRKTPKASRVDLKSNGAQALQGLPVTFTATIGSVEPNQGLPSGTVRFMAGDRELGSAVLNHAAHGVATVTVTDLAVGAHEVTAVYEGAGSFMPASSDDVPVTVAPSLPLNINLLLHEVKDTAANPLIAVNGVAEAEVRVYARSSSCMAALFGSDRSLARIFGAADGSGAAGAGCPVVSVGTYRALGHTNGSGDVQIAVPRPVASSTGYIVIARVPARDGGEPIYVKGEVAATATTDSGDLRLHLIGMPDGTRLPASEKELDDRGLRVVEPEYIERSRHQSRYPVLVSGDGAWSVTASVAWSTGTAAEQPTLVLASESAARAGQLLVSEEAAAASSVTIEYRITRDGTVTTQSSRVRVQDAPPDQRE